MKKLLITGSNGFVGNYFRNEHESKYSMETFSFLKDDIGTLDCTNIDAIFHLSALVHQMGGASEDEYEKVNVAQTLYLARKAKEAGVGQFVFMSTVKVYGEESDETYTEYSTCKPLDAYGRSKRKAEEELLKLETENFKISIIRTPIVYGAGVKANIQSLTRLIQKLPVLPFGGIQNKRSFVYVGNLCHLVNEVLLQQKGGIFLASDNAPLSTTRLCELITQGLGKKVWLIKIPFFETIVKKLKPAIYQRLYGNLEVDNTASKNMLNLKNPYSTEKGIRLMLQDEAK
ncbi:MAG: NAD-dependent epimerase/dehydratase family protein [Campylobacterales bacterium]|nr:NAD-dependent epimerase/dehydratase family protein [Campylobacterales bacterium]